MNAQTHSHAADLLKEIAVKVTSQLSELLQPVTPETESIYRAMRYSTLAGGKRFRPALVILTARMLGAEERAAMPAACAIEMVHTYSLIHDDLPAMDDDDLRRGRPTNHKVFGEAMAVLAGDALLTEAFAVLTSGGGLLEAGQQVRLVRELATAAGASGMACGQVADLDAERNADSTVEVETIHRLKTARMIEAAVAMGAIVGQASPAEQERLRTYGRHVGLAFQIADDIMDARSTTEEMGKTAGKDAAQGKRTYVSVYGAAEAQERAGEELGAALAALADFGPRADALAALARFCVERQA
ncbi:MAG: hypothetical protein GWP05_05925 [Anaerolineaceae bacterium]|nr:hypothetical protein [Anaerolineaceae bacterium]